MLARGSGLLRLTRSEANCGRAAGDEQRPAELGWMGCPGGRRSGWQMSRKRSVDGGDRERQTYGRSRHDSAVDLWRRVPSRFGGRGARVKLAPTSEAAAGKIR